MCEDHEAEGRLPSITSQFVSRKPGDRPDVRPHGAENFAFLRQFVEQSRDFAFTVEYSVRSAKAAVTSLTGRFDPPSSSAWTDLGPLVLAKAGRVLLGLRSSAKVCSALLSGMWHIDASHVSMNDSLFRYSEIIDWWEAERLAASQACNGLEGTLLERAKQETENVAHHHLLMEDSDERKNLEAFIFKEIHKLDKKFLMATVKGIGQDPVPSGQGANVSQYAGWSFWDIGKLIFGGGTAGSAAIAGSRVAPAALAAVGLSALAGPISIAAGLAGLAWSAYSVSGQKRSEYLQALNAGISKKLTATDDPEKSVLSRQLARLDALRDIRLEPFL